MLAEYDLEPTNIRHNKFDLVALYLKDEEEFQAKTALSHKAHILELDSVTPSPGDVSYSSIFSNKVGTHCCWARFRY